MLKNMKKKYVLTRKLGYKMTEIEKKLRQELKDQIEENKELLKINEEHKKLNGELRKENDGLVTVIDLVKESINKNKKVVKEIHSANGDSMKFYELCIDPDELLEILERVEKVE